VGYGGSREPLRSENRMTADMDGQYVEGIWHKARRSAREDKPDVLK
jgi:hypothetical protein